MMTLQNYSTLSLDEARSRILDIKRQMGEKLLLMAHNYQSRDVYELADVTGDSLELARKAYQAASAELIVFAGVHFMAESARILARDHQRVFIPNPQAGCPMADMAGTNEAEAAWAQVKALLGDAVIPITYVNSSAEIKALCGREGGLCATSGNSKEVFRWAYERKRTILFFPDEFLGRNTANALKVPREEQVLWDPQAGRLGGLEAQDIQKARIVLWKGFCHVHVDLTVEDIVRARASHPKAVIIVHPEAREEVVAAADEAGSTKFMQDYIDRAPDGAEIVLGTEVNHARNLSYRYPTKKIRALVTNAVCPNMAKTHLKHILYTLETLPKAHEVLVSELVRRDARLALERMLEVTK